jgi:ADP-ribosylglycohydrolase
VAAGSTPGEALTAVGNRFKGGTIDGWLKKGMDSAGQATRAAILGFGQQCSIGAAFPAVIHLLTRYPEDIETALVENVMAGGDSAARGMIVGMVLGAHLGTAAIPEHWLTGMSAYNRIASLLNS